MPTNLTETPPIAFVLMKFSTDARKDKTYQALCEVIEDAGFRPLRADQIATSGPVVDEVCELLRNAPLALIDTSGDSHSVSYELGYAHGVGRSHERTVILRSVSSGPIPFNYAHYRLLVYRDRGDLKQRLRSWLNISMPLSMDQLGYVLNFSVMENAGEYGAVIASAILEALEVQRFSGRCEYYAGDLCLGQESFYIVGLAVKSETGRVPKLEWWEALVASVSTLLHQRRAKAALNSELSELCEVASLRMRYLPRGVVEFRSGVPEFILGGDLDVDTWFLVECKDRMATANNIASENGKSNKRRS